MVKDVVENILFVDRVIKNITLKTKKKKIYFFAYRIKNLSISFYNGPPQGAKSCPL